MYRNCGNDLSILTSSLYVYFDRLQSSVEASGVAGDEVSEPEATGAEAESTEIKKRHTFIELQHIRIFAVPRRTTLRPLLLFLTCPHIFCFCHSNIFPGCSLCLQDLPHGEQAWTFLPTASTFSPLFNSAKAIAQVNPPFFIF